MIYINEQFLKIIKSALRGEPLQQLGEVTAEEWEQILALAESQKVLPLVYEAIYSAPDVKNGESAAFARSKRMVRYQVMTQAIKTEEFLQLNELLEGEGIRPLVVKGVICRELYPLPDHRISSDEDVLIPAQQYEQCHAVLEKLGLCADEAKRESAAYEVDYRKENSPLYIELHTHLFPPESEAYGDLNRFFADVFARAIPVNIRGNVVHTLEYTDHLFYLICHAFKHFIHSGFGIRQVCDIVMYANTYGDRIDWERAYRNCCEIHAEVFAAAVFEIGRKHLVFDPKKAKYPDHWRELAVDEADMLEDLLSGGVYGGSTMSRKHSSNITLTAVADHKKGKKRPGSVIRTVFPGAKQLVGRYPYLRKRPYLLPVAWVDRILKYQKETRSTQHNNASESMRIGAQRIELLRKYGVIR